MRVQPWLNKQMGACTAIKIQISMYLYVLIKYRQICIGKQIYGLKLEFFRAHAMLLEAKAAAVVECGVCSVISK